MLPFSFFYLFFFIFPNVPFSIIGLQEERHFFFFIKFRKQTAEFFFSTEIVTENHDATWKVVILDLFCDALLPE